ncbi:MAG: hypothetical protein LUG94_02195 [Ruminococcus sp.]|nr:hypothetical protein [Ruminococcus sp.]
MKNKIFLLGAIILMCCPMVYGCSSSDSETDSSSSSNSSSSSSSWDKTINEVYDLALDEDTYPFADEIYINVSDEKKLVDYTVIVANDTTSEEAVQYASDLITMFNDVASNSDDSITKSSDGNYGSLFDEYDVLMTIATEESVLNEKDWLVCQTIKAGEHTPIEAGGFSEDEE